MGFSQLSASAGPSGTRPAPAQVRAVLRTSALLPRDRWESGGTPTCSPPHPARPTLVRLPRPRTLHSQGIPAGPRSWVGTCTLGTSERGCGLQLLPGAQGAVSLAPPSVGPLPARDKVRHREPFKGAEPTGPSQPFL